MNKEKAAEYFRGDIDCSQIVLANSAEKVGLDSDTALKLGSAFGGGMWHGETCGCVTGALMAIGAGYGQTEPGDSEGKALLLAKKQQFEERFMEENGSLNCRRLLGYDVSDPDDLAKIVAEDMFYTRCTGYVCSACRILDEIL